MNALPLDPLDLVLASLLVLALGLSSLRLGLGVGRSLATGAARTTLQLLLAGLVLKALFASRSPWLIGLAAAVMLTVAGREVRARQSRPFLGPWGYTLGLSAMFISGFAVTLFALLALLRPDPWYHPRYALPLLGMILGNTMNGVGLALERLGSGAEQRRRQIEAALLLGQDWREASAPLRRESVRAGMVPVLNSLASAGIVSLPGMMTGQILAGADPSQAVMYQILIMFLIAAGSGFGGVAAVQLGARRLFDERERLRLDRLGRRD
ncbi:MAG: iron export ABC transporter permease subunit FetB [Candidatus Krumholzibacteriia bacterium]|nr:iron export ABC transporter permease subunit FetB [bacterium]MCB9512873.1 iron export ABC transporter permease subunit FetB [Candidatus Latescibacterota bacterium]MCB9516959.1 iron export ABC transporter permease subunit FetB [Candidatus Latescibacterota bacterium]